MPSSCAGGGVGADDADGEPADDALWTSVVEGMLQCVRLILNLRLGNALRAWARSTGNILKAACVQTKVVKVGKATPTIVKVLSHKGRMRKLTHRSHH